MGQPAGPFRSLAMRASGPYLVFVHASLAPSAAEWSAVLELYRAHANLKAARTLVYTEGGAPSAAQRADLNAVVGKVKIPFAVMTSSTIARAAGVALSFINPGFGVFSATDFDGALDHLGASTSERRTLRDLVDELRRELAARHTATARDG